MKKTNENFKRLLSESNVRDEIIELIENVLQDILTNKMSNQEIMKKNIDALIEKEVMRHDS